ncbi:MAG: hypothetical protein IJQ24_00265 [Synergistaceae bacterium]|nr:hypothetical protein [Synergistaceae bacterium]
MKNINIINFEREQMKISFFIIRRNSRYLSRFPSYEQWLVAQTSEGNIIKRYGLTPTYAQNFLDDDSAPDDGCPETV